MSQRRHPQTDLFKTPHEFTLSQRTTAVALLKALLIEAISAQRSAAAAARSTAEGNDVEIGEDVGE
jgi:hypothetical protein